MNTRHEILHPLIVLGLFAFAPTFASAAVPAFPGAQGGGAASVGGRGGQVIEVTNLNDSGAGSLRACMLATGPRTCVFRVGGTIQLLSVIRVTTPFLTVAGQTAPGGGILLSGKNSSQGMVVIATHDVILRYMRIRKGFNSGCADECGTNTSLAGKTNGYNNIVDHVSTSWNQDEGIGTNTGVHNVTFSWNITAEPVGSTEQAHPTGMSSLAGSTASANTMTNIDFHHNLTMNNSHRNPLLRNKSSRIVNNLWYNHRWYINFISGGMNGDVIGTRYKLGPISRLQHPDRHEIEVSNTGAGKSIAASGDPSVFLSGNLGYNQSNPAGDQWAMARQANGENGAEIGAVPTAWRRTSAMANTTHPITAEAVSGLEASVLSLVGASRRLNFCNGDWVGNRDSVDTRLVNEYTNNTGTSVLYRNEADYGGFPVISGGTPCTDTDHDGMPDVWETARGLNPNNAADRNAVATSGYTEVAPTIETVG